MEKQFNAVTAAKGFLAAGVAAGVKKRHADKKDIAVIYSQFPAAAAGVFTTNRFCAAPVIVSREVAAGGRARAVVANSGNANACTGEQGEADARGMAGLTADLLGIPAAEVFVASTGVIGYALPMEAIEAGIKQTVKALSRGGGKDAAFAIMTTDTFPKEASESFELRGKTVTIGGIAKGSGMIHPNMATMLGFITTDIAIEPQALDQALRLAAAASFNMITVDQDTSTNDSLIVLANGAAENTLLRAVDADFPHFCAALERVCVKLGKMIAKDGEGATKLCEVEVSHARSLKDARLAAKAVAASSLVKAALFGNDPNWGRIVCALGYSGAAFDPGKVDVTLISAFGAEAMMRQGNPLPFDEEKARNILKEKEVKICLDLKEGAFAATAWGCDLSYDYVKINADYRS